MIERRRERYCLVAKMKIKTHLGGFCLYESFFCCQVLKEIINHKKVMMLEMDRAQQSNELLRSGYQKTNLLRTESIACSQSKVFGLHNESFFHKNSADVCESVEFLFKIEDISNINVNILVQERESEREREMKITDYHSLNNFDTNDILISFFDFTCIRMDLTVMLQSKKMFCLRKILYESTFEFCDSQRICQTSRHIHIFQTRKFLTNS
jgi:hypothetical protein